MPLESRWTPLFVCGVVLLIFSGLPFFGIVESFEAKATDYFIRWHYVLFGAEVPEDVVLIAIDEYSVDPAASVFSDVWGKGGWLNRDNWVFNAQFLKDFFHPKVIAFDILFPESRYQELSTRGKELAEAFELRSSAVPKRKLYEIESQGNDSLSMIFFDMEEERVSGGEAIYPILGYTFPEDPLARNRLKGKYTGRDLENFTATLLLPPGIVHNGERLPDQQAIHLPVQQFLFSPVVLGPLNVPRDTGGLVRRVPMVHRLVLPDGQDAYFPGFALLVFLYDQDIDLADLHPLGKGVPAMAITPGEELILDTGEKTYRVPLDASGRLVLFPRFRYTDLNVVSFSYLTQYGLYLEAGSGATHPQRAEADNIKDRVKGKMAFIGVAHTGGGDTGNFTLEEDIPNVTAHIIATDNLFKQTALVPPNWTMRVLMACLVAAVGYLVWIQLGERNVLSTPFLLLPLLLPVFSWVMLLEGWILEPIVPTSMALVLMVSQGTNAYLQQTRRRTQLKKMFSAAVSPHVLELMEKRGGEISLEGQKLDATIFFSDLAGFTSISEKLSPQDLSRLLNRYFTPMSDIILESDGYVDKYEGDAIMAVWGAPFPDREHAMKACGAALAQLNRLQVLSGEIQNETGIRLSVRIGINSGEVSAGNMGSEKKFQYTVMGDAVNLAARLEPVNKDYGTSVILGEATQELLPEGLFQTRLLNKILVKGKTRAVKLYELIFPQNDVGAWVEIYENALELMWRRQWDEAEAGFRQVLEIRQEDLASLEMLRRLDAFRKSAPEDGWDGTHARSRKD